MRFYNTFKKDNGNYSTQEWSSDEEFNYGFIKFIVIGLIVSFVSAIASVICIIARIWDYEENEKKINYIGVFTAMYFIFDIKNGWVINWVLNIFLNPETIKGLFIWNVSLLATHILLLIFGDTVFYNINNEENRKPLLFIITLFGLILSFFIVKAFIG